MVINQKTHHKKFITMSEKQYDKCPALLPYYDVILIVLCARVANISDVLTCTCLLYLSASQPAPATLLARSSQLVAPSVAPAPGNALVSLVWEAPTVTSA